MKKNILNQFVILFILGIALISCGKDTPKSGKVNINFGYTVGDRNMELNVWDYKSPFGYDFRITRVRYLLSRLSLIDSEGKEVALALSHFIDIGNEPDTKMLSVSDVKAGNYSALKFTFGASQEDNSVDVLPNTAHYQTFLWPKGITGEGLPRGFHYMQYEGNYTDIDHVYAIHLGPTKGNDNSFEVTLSFDKTMEIDDNTLTIDLVCDLLEWLQNPNTYDYAKYGPMIMPQQPAQLELKANGISVFSLGAVNVK